jgi:hypothetical protein
MPQSNQTAEFNTFVGGLVTEASPLTFPENASIDEANFELNKDGSRVRRLGMDYEDGLTALPLSYTITPIGDPVITTFEWVDVAGIPSKAFVVCQVHDKAYIMDRSDETLKSVSYVKHTFNLCTTCQTPEHASFASVDGKLIVAYNDADIKVVSYSEVEDLAGSALSLIFPEEVVRLKTRDLFGVEDKFDNSGTEIDLLSPEYINFRPVSVADEDNHMYNLRNQGWAPPRLQWTGSTKSDTVTDFEIDGADNRGLPSNADTPVTSLFQNGTDPTERFNDDAQALLEPSKSRAAVGHIVIDLLDRGASREAEIARITNTTDGVYVNANPAGTPTYITYRTPTVSLPVDRTTGGAKVVAEYAGRVFYGGFSSENTGADSQSPNLGAYLFYSQLVRDGSQINRCYQEGDPTGPEAPDLLETDGGFVRVAGAYNIQEMINVGQSLLIFAENGVWALSGSDTGVFTATNQSVSKISEHGTISPQSVVLVDGTVMYWSDDAIYHAAPSDVGMWSVKELSVNIRTYYQAISSEGKVKCQGSFDSYDKKVRWLFHTASDSDGPTTELVFDLVLAAFYPIVIGSTGDAGPIPVAPIQVSPFNVSTVDLTVVAGADIVMADLDTVVAGIPLAGGGFRETAYLTLINSIDSNSTSLITSSYSDNTFVDWYSVDSVGVDSPAFLLTGYMGNGDFHRHKQIPYVHFHFLRTEDGFIDTGDDFTPTNQSSCLVQAQWDWTNSTSYGKWGRTFQAYRYRRRYNPEDALDAYDYGTTTIVTRNKLRGRGRVVSFLISSEAAKDMKLLGWSMTLGMNNNG